MSLSHEAAELLREAASADGTIIRIKSFSGLTVQANRKNFVTERNPRVEALWDAAFNELVSMGFVKSLGGKNEIYQVTHSGYQYVDSDQ